MGGKDSLETIHVENTAAAYMVKEPRELPAVLAEPFKVVREERRQAVVHVVSSELSSRS